MSKKVVLGIVLTLLLTSMSIFASKIQPARASGTIYIRADGSIDPPSTPISTTDNITYTFTGDIYDEIVVERNNTIIDGDRYTLQGSEVGEGFNLNHARSVRIENMEIRNFTYAILIVGSSYISIYKNCITNNFQAIWLSNSSDNNISGNNITQNSWGIKLTQSSNNSISDNNIITNSGTAIDLYKFSSNNTISRNNITQNTDHCMRIEYSSENNSISRNNITDNYYGIWVSGFSHNTKITGNNIKNNGAEGIKFSDSSNNTVTGNLFAGDGLTVYYSYRNVVTDNWVNDKPLVYLESMTDYVVEDAGQLILVNCNGIKARNLNLSNIERGVLLWQTNNTEIFGNTIRANYDSSKCIELFRSNNNSLTGNDIAARGLATGIDLYESLYNNISRNKITKNWAGIVLDAFSNNNTISKNDITNNTFGIQLWWSSTNTISGNNITANYHDGILVAWSADSNSLFGNKIADNDSGITLLGVSNNSIFENYILANNDYGVELSGEAFLELWSSDNSLYHNNFIDNAAPVYVGHMVDKNSWDNGCEGNYWAHYNVTDSDGDGISDIPFVIDENNTDRYPLMNLYWNPCDINHDLKVNMRDVGAPRRGYGTEPGDIRWNCHADITGPIPLEPDSKVDMRDIGLIASNFGETYQ